MTKRLQVGDIITVNHPLLNSGDNGYAVEKIEGNKAFTKFRTFNTRVYDGRYVYEYGKKLSPVYNNVYTVE